MGRKLLCVVQGRAEVSSSEQLVAWRLRDGEGGGEGGWSNPSKFAKAQSRIWLLRLRLPESGAKKYNCFLVNLFVLH